MGESLGYLHGLIYSLPSLLHMNKIWHIYIVSVSLYVSVLYVSEDSIPGFKRQGSSGGQAATGDAVRPALREPQQQRPVGTGGGAPTLRCG